MFATDFNFATELTLWAVEAYRVVFEGGWVVSPCAHISPFPEHGGGFLSFATAFATDLVAKILPEMSDNNGNEYPYRLCVIKDRNGDLSKRWYVEFWVWDLRVNNTVRKQVFISSTQYKTAKERMAYGKYLKKSIDQMLVQGKILGRDEAEIENTKPKKKSRSRSAIFKDEDLFLALEYARKAKQVGNSKRTEQVYDTIYNRLVTFLTKEGITKLSELNTALILEFMDWLVDEFNLSNTTRNNYRENVRSLFGVLVTRKVMKKNPARKVRRLKESKSRHTAYRDDDAKKVKKAMTAKDPQLFLFCSFIYYCFLRPKELRFLQVKHIEGDKILVPSFIVHEGEKIFVSKNRKNEYVIIPNGLKKLIEQHKIMEYPPDYFIFSILFKPAPKHVSYNYFNRRYRDVLDELGFEQDYTAYSWKHTGVIRLYNEIKDIRKVQQQCRHSKIETTVEYLRDLGLFDNKEVEMLFPEF